MRGRGLEPPRLAAYAPQTYASTIPPPAQSYLKSFLEKLKRVLRSPDIKIGTKQGRAKSIYYFQEPLE